MSKKKKRQKKKGKNEALQNIILATAIINLIISVLQLLNLIPNKQLSKRGEESSPHSQLTTKIRKSQWR